MVDRPIQQLCQFAMKNIMVDQSVGQKLWLWLGCCPLPVTVTTRIITFLVENPYKPSFATVTGWGVDPSYDYETAMRLDVLWQKGGAQSPFEQRSKALWPLWLVFREPYNGLWQSLYNWVVFHPLHRQHRSMVLVTVGKGSRENSSDAFWSFWILLTPWIAPENKKWVSKMSFCFW